MPFKQMFWPVNSMTESCAGLIEHFLTRTTPNRPICVLSLTIITDLKLLILALPNENPTVSIAIIGYVQTKPSRPIAMTKWIPSATWEPVSGGLCSNGEFLADMDSPNDLTYRGTSCPYSANWV